MNNQRDVIEVIQAGDIENAYSSVEDKTEQQKKTEALRDALQGKDNAYLHISRIEHGNEQFIDKIPSDKFDYSELQMFLRDKWGGGDYRLRLYGKTWKGNFGIIENTLINIAKSTAVAVHGAGNTSDLSQLINVIQEQNNRIIAIINERNQQPSITEKLTELKMLSEMFKAPEPQPRESMREMVETMVLMQSMFNRDKDDEPKDDGLLKILGQLGQVAALSMANRQTQQPQTQHYQPQQNESEQMNFMLKQGLKLLLSGAQKGSDPADYAGMVNDQLSDEQKGLLTPETFDQLAEQMPELKEHKDWFIDLGEHVKALNGDETSKFFDQYTE